jgi:2-polyprenyl-3-methyl-5-hydroxy-6-metoxy-1,4-benzoquinol methylase
MAVAAIRHEESEFGTAVRYYVLDSLNLPPSTENSGPGEFVGDILQHPDLIWSQDKWDEERYQLAEERLQLQSRVVSPYWRDRYENKSKIFWHEFYKRNSDHFYKDRHYLHIVFPELKPPVIPAPNTLPIHLLEIGCGVGNAVTPLLEIHPTLVVHAMDLAPSAIKILRSSSPHRSLCSRT